MSEADLASMNAVVLRFPSAPNIVRYAAALSINGRPAAASDTLRRVCKMHPERACDAMRSLWQRLGEREPEIARVVWPS